MNRSEFVALACAQAMHAVNNAAERREHVANLLATAEALADALGFGEAARAPVDAAADRLSEREQEYLATIADLRAKLTAAQAAARVAAQKPASK